MVILYGALVVNLLCEAKDAPMMPFYDCMGDAVLVVLVNIPTSLRHRQGMSALSVCDVTTLTGPDTNSQNAFLKPGC